ncbi:hypothetical protein B7R54_18035 [Subtercola boreus]|uniref:Major facilitator superfamily (MFS) profile domain-containing protein n=1 Tax=Subtercola boreus TaxID=120213 RepID=A0A3E0VMI7_9MICO|nr:MFS transporter [Subtercola boreus]RFA10895.1 hypothetical protein B7R54_18035 [Subtercola boreus]TQL55518.1 putative MFS family arabinose efflux permease [Subtercola boreus]
MSHLDHRARRITVAAAATFVLLLGSNMPTPLYAVFAQQLDFGVFTLTAIYAAYFLALVPTLLGFGSLSDRFGRRPVVRAGLAVALVAALVFASADSLTALFVARVLQGVAVGLLSGALSATLVDASPRRGATVSTVSILAGGALGPLVGGLLARAVPGSPGAAFWIVVASSAVVLALTHTLPRERRPTADRSTRRAALPTAVWWGAAIAGLGWATAGLSLGLLPTALGVTLPNTSTFTATLLVTVMMGASAVTQLTLGATRLPLGTAGLVAVPLAAVTLTLGLALASLPVVAIGSVLSGVGLGCAFLGGMRIAAAAAAPPDRARALSIFFAVAYLATGVPTLAVGALSAVTGLLPAIVGFACAVVVVAVCLGLRAPAAPPQQRNGTRTHPHRAHM